MRSLIPIGRQTPSVSEPAPEPTDETPATWQPSALPPGWKVYSISFRRDRDTYSSRDTIDLELRHVSGLVVDFEFERVPDTEQLNVLLVTLEQNEGASYINVSRD